MSNDKHVETTPVKAPLTSSTVAHAHPAGDWLREWPSITVPTRNGANQQNYQPKIEKYINAWLDLVGDVHESGRKFKLRSLVFQPVEGSNSEFKVVATASSIDNIPPATSKPNVNKTKSTGGSGLPGEKPAGEHLIPPPPPPPPVDDSL